jgi:hypothetical protein
VHGYHRQPFRPRLGWLFPSSGWYQARAFSWGGGVKLYWYSHRLTSADPAVQAANLRRSRGRLEHLRPAYRARGIWLSAPWLDWAECGIPEAEAWQHIATTLPWHAGILLDCDGGAASAGMMRETQIMRELGRVEEVVW